MWIQVQPNITLKEEGSSITVNGMSIVIGPTVTSNTTSPSEVVCVPLKPTRILFGFLRMPS